MQDGSKINVLFNSGSQVALVTQELADRLNLSRDRKSNIEVVGIGEGVSQPDYIRMVHVDTRSGETVTFPAHSVKQLNIENCSPEWSKVVELFPLSDLVKFSSPMGKIVLLIGMDLAQFMPKEIKRNGGSVLLKSELNSQEPLIIAGRIEEQVVGEVVSLAVRVTIMITTDFLSAEGFGVEIPRRCRACASCKECKFETVSL